MWEGPVLLNTSLQVAGILVALSAPTIATCVQIWFSNKNAKEAARLVALAAVKVDAVHDTLVDSTHASAEQLSNITFMVDGRFSAMQEALRQATDEIRHLQSERVRIAAAAQPHNE